MDRVSITDALLSRTIDQVTTIIMREVALDISRSIVPILMDAEVSNEVIEKVLLAIERESA